MADKNGFYFDNLLEAAECCVKAAEYLEECFKSYRTENISEMLKKMHETEHMGDEKRHEMMSALAKAFVTPVDREDLALLSGKIDDVMDRIEEVLQRRYIDGVTQIRQDAVIFSGKIADCARKMRDVISAFRGFKKAEKLHSLIVELNRTEEECDRFYLECSKNAVNECENPLDVFTWRAIYDMLEECADECEHVGDCVDPVIMKST
ncbi:MAG: DUF47 family protein [Clostridia bacterium]|nr:DUF47 family protein [Clostridia bacterium]